MSHTNLDRIEGVLVSLRLAEPSDAGYIHALRTNPAYNTHLSAVTGSVGDQENWLRRYKAREAAGTEYYYVIERKVDGQPCGLVRLYDITDETFTWGSWILDHNKPAKAALESAVLSFGVGFDRLGLRVAYVDVRNDNDKARAFYERFGMTYLRHDDVDTYFEYSRVQYHRDLDGHMKTIRSSLRD